MIKLIDLLYQRMANIYEKVKTAVFPLCLAVLSLAASLYVFTQTYVNRYVLFGAVWCITLFTVFSLLPKVKQKAVKPITHIALLSVSLFIPISYLSQMGSRMSGLYNFIVWFFSGSELENTRPEYLFAFTFMAGYFFTFALWYFTNRVYRKQVVFLVSIMPFVIFVKAVSPIPYVFIILSAAFNIFIYLAQERIKIERNGTVGGKRNMLTVYGDFAIALVLLVFILPKPAETPYYERFQSVLNNYRFGNFGDGDSTYGRFNRRSGNADAFNRSQLRTLYYAAMEDSSYLKIQAYPYYDEQGNYWYLPDDEEEWYELNFDWESDTENASINAFASVLVKIYDYDPTDPLYPGIENDIETLRDIAEGGGGDIARTAVIQAADFPAVYLAAPSRTFKAENPLNELYKLRYGGGLFTETEMNPYAYSIVNYYSDDYLRYSGWFDLEIGKLDSEQFKATINEAQERIVNFENTYSPVLKSITDEVNDSFVYSPDYNAEALYTSPRIAELAAQITAGIDTDFAKSEAIERYFYDSGYEYVLGFEPPVGSDTAEYFIFESKTGTCSDFATAFTLLAQSAGLTVRYCEGYVPVMSRNIPSAFADTIDNPNLSLYEITSDNAHAYPEVYLNGGWVRFEPTVGSLTDPAASRAGGGTAAAADPVVILAVIIAVIIAAAGFVVFLVLLPTLREWGFAVTVKLKRPENALRAVYLRTGAYLSPNYRHLTAGELSDLAKAHYNSDISALTIPFVNHLFGGEAITSEQIKKAFAAYRQFKRDIRDTRKREKRAKRRG
ncbi:MAG: transglutaminase-like domain-containing protein [Ruminococcus sp.]|jgi:transglutaminase-like putative cysteine protease|nr:transglutaminase-like domain-containing protein [Ruminococcus sp.]